MFGEHESESPRVPSPWDPFLPSPPNEQAPDVGKHFADGIPKLVPEVEEGNVEYKLKLTHISDARFARLVTQLKWRLLEGGGQAYYELGVADSGALVGLSRADLEESLQSLEMMAGEIGASVIVVKEIEVPSVMVALSDQTSGYIDPQTGEWTMKMRHKMSTARIASGVDGDISTETESESEITDFTDYDEDSWPHTDSSIGTPAESSFSSSVSVYAHRFSTNPSRPSYQNSPYIAAVDDDPDVSSMDSHAAQGDIPIFDLEISSVYKPRPARRRAEVPPVLPNMPALQPKRVKRLIKGMDVEKKTWPKSIARSDGSGSDVSQEAKALQRRLARDMRREEKRKAYRASTGAMTETVLSSPSSDMADDSRTSVDTAMTKSTAAATTQSTEDTAHLLSDLDTLHAAMDSLSVSDVQPVIAVTPPEDSAIPHLEAGSVSLVPKPKTNMSHEPRLIVEALVVRKMSIEEAFLDFGGFGLI